MISLSAKIVREDDEFAKIALMTFIICINKFNGLKRMSEKKR